MCRNYFRPLFQTGYSLFLSACAIIITTGFIISLFFNKYQRNILYGLTLTLSLFLLGLLLYANEKKSLSDLKSESTVFICTLSDYPEEKENSYLLEVKLNCINSIKGYGAGKRIYAVI